ncbi:MAG: hypothetical protein CM1200mP1_11790 [Candidatus Neomarinimicrobiota bacterium]|nr:MAG: hypothetical protein CM1200mP1_11790 [Candidatus Neomarinimicrobiota bacterium]
MIATIINTLTAPGETFDTIVKDYNWKNAMMPLSLLWGLLFFRDYIIGSDCRFTVGANSGKYKQKCKYF